MFFPRGRIELYTVLMVFSLSRILVKNLIKNIMSICVAVGGKLQILCGFVGSFQSLKGLQKGFNWNCNDSSD